MEQKKKHKNILLIVLGILFLGFIVLYAMQANGYYEYQNYIKTNITEDAMKRFEDDVALGKDIDINDYLADEYKDYSNSMSNLGYKTGEAIEVFMNKGIGEIFKVFGALFGNK